MSQMQACRLGKMNGGTFLLLWKGSWLTWWDRLTAQKYSLGGPVCTTLPWCEAHTMHYFWQVTCWSGSCFDYYKTKEQRCSVGPHPNVKGEITYRKGSNRHLSWRVLETSSSKVIQRLSFCLPTPQALVGSGQVWHQESSLSPWGTLHYIVNSSVASTGLAGSRTQLSDSETSFCSDLAKPNVLRFRTCCKESLCSQAPGQKYEGSDWGWKGTIFCLLLSSQMGKRLIYFKGFVNIFSVHVPGVMERPIFKYWDL